MLKQVSGSMLQIAAVSRLSRQPLLGHPNVNFFAFVSTSMPTAGPAQPAVAIKQSLQNSDPFRSCDNASPAAGSTVDSHTPTALPTNLVSQPRQTSSGTPTQTCTPVLDFSNAEYVFQNHSTSELLRGYLVFRACGIQPLVSNSERLIDLSRSLLGSRITYSIIKHTFFKHFCAGETREEVQATAQRLRSSGVGSILDYAAEDDVGGAGYKPRNTATDADTTTAGVSTAQAAQAHGTAPSHHNAASKHHSTRASRQALGGQSMIASRVVARTYDYSGEATCDAHVDHFLHAVDMAAQAPWQGFAAVKVTALGNPQLLERMSSGVNAMMGLFKRFDEDGSGAVDRREFEKHYQSLLGACEPQELTQAFAAIDAQASGHVDYVDWCSRLRLTAMPRFAARMLEQHEQLQAAAAGKSDGTEALRLQLANIFLTEEEVSLAEAMMGRLERVVHAAKEAGSVALMIDAEHTYFQPAIDHVVLQLMREHNRADSGKPPMVFHTYQAYLRDTRGRLLRDLERASREGWVLGAKLVRGAYLHLERRRAESKGLPSPCWDAIEETHASYAACLDDLMDAAAQGRAQVLVGSHNQTSVEQAVAGMAARGIAPGQGTVHFGQLLGMSDHLTLTLGRAGYSAYKYVPYGKVGQVMPYLLRRATENADVLKGSKADLRLLGDALKRRAFSMLH